VRGEPGQPANHPAVAGLVFVLLAAAAVVWAAELAGAARVVALGAVAVGFAAYARWDRRRLRAAWVALRHHRDEGWELRRGVWVPVAYAAHRRRAPLRRAWRGLGRGGVLGVLVAFVLGLGTFTAALDGLFERMGDRCREFGPCDPVPPTPTAPPPFLVGTLSEVRLGAARVPQLVAWTERGLATPEGLSAQDAAWPGRLVTYRVELRGLAGAECRVRWTLLDAASGERVVDARYGWVTVDAVAFPDSKWTAQAPEEDVNVGLFWVPYVAPGAFVVEVELLNPDGVHLDVERTEEFVVAADDLPAPG
jgi:hypothetical protein